LSIKNFEFVYKKETVKNLF
jgi:hypothetical protein